MTSEAILCSTYVNALSIVESLRRISWQGRITALKSRGQGPVLLDLVAPDVAVVEIDFREPGDLLSWLAARKGADQQVVFLTNERFHEALLSRPGRGDSGRVHAFVGSATHLDTILDRQIFCDFVTSLGVARAPRTVPSSADPWSTLGGSFLVRVRRSWRGLDKLPRARVVHGRKDLGAIERQFFDDGLARDEWCYQELLSVAARHNVSVCGWHDAAHQDYVTTRKVLQHPPRTGNGDVCEVISAVPELQDTTHSLLDAVGYEGPFELEFVLDTRTGHYHVIELNPRFWMQHALVESATGDALVRRCAGVTCGDPVTTSERPVRYWVNGVYALYRLVRGDARIMRYLLSRASIVVPSLPHAMRWAFLQARARRPVGASGAATL